MVLLAKLNNTLFNMNYNIMVPFMLMLFLWLRKENIERISNEIIAFVLAPFDENISKFIEPIDNMQKLLYKLVIHKQLHSCHNRCVLEKTNDKCKFGFPYLEHISQKPTLNNDSNTWEYYRPRYVDLNVFTYHPTLLLSWGAHMNMLRITSSHWSYYLLKYSMKCEPHGCIELNVSNLVHLGLQNVPLLQLKLISTLIKSKPISPIEAALTCLQIPIVQKNIGVKYIDINHIFKLNYCQNQDILDNILLTFTNVDHLILKI